MDIALLVVTAVASLAAVVSAAVAIVQARAAGASEREAANARNESRDARDESVRIATEANEAFRRQAVAQERANALKEAELASPTWSTPRHVSGDLFSVTNTSGRTVFVGTFDVEPDEAAKFVRVGGSESGIYATGDSFDFMAARGLSIRARKLTVSWRFADDPEQALRKWIIQL